MRRPIPLLLLLLLCPLGSAASGLHGAWNSDGASFDDARLEAPALFFGALEPGTTSGGAWFTLQASSADVVVTHQPYVQPAGSGIVYTEEATTDEPVHHDAVAASSSRAGLLGFVHAEGLHGPGGASTFRVEAPVVALSPRPDLAFHRPHDAGTSQWMPYRVGAWPNLEGTAAGREPAVLRGDLVLTFFDVDLTLRSGGDVATYRTGHVYDPALSSSAVAQGESRRVEVTLHDAVVTYHPEDRAFQVNTLGGTVHADGHARFLGARGSLHAGGDDAPFEGALDLDARWAGTVALEDDHLATTLTSGDLRVARVDGADLHLAVVSPSSPLARSGWAGLSSAAVLTASVAGGIGWRIHARRLDPDTLVLAAEWALDQGRPGRASRWAGRALARDAGDHDAALVRAVALYRMGRHEAAVRWLRAWIDEHGDPEGDLTLALGLGVLATEGPRQAAPHVEAALRIDARLGDLLPVPTPRGRPTRA